MTSGGFKRKTVAEQRAEAAQALREGDTDEDQLWVKVQDVSNDEEPFEENTTPSRASKWRIGGADDKAAVIEKDAQERQNRLLHLQTNDDVSSLELASMRESEKMRFINRRGQEESSKSNSSAQKRKQKQQKQQKQQKFDGLPGQVEEDWYGTGQVLNSPHDPHNHKWQTAMHSMRIQPSSKRSSLKYKTPSKDDARTIARVRLAQENLRPRAGHLCEQRIVPQQLW